MILKDNFFGIFGLAVKAGKAMLGTFACEKGVKGGDVYKRQHIDCYVSKNYLKRELDRAKKTKTTPDCRQGCTGCGFEKRCNNAHRN